MSAETPRYPFDRLADHLHLTPNQAVNHLGIRGSTGQDYRRRGLTARVAWRLAEKARVHPYEIWPELRDDELAAVERECADDRCTETFTPTNPRRIYCTTTCRDRAAKRNWARNRYQTDPNYRQRRKQASAARYDTERDYILEQRRRRARALDTQRGAA